MTDYTITLIPRQPARNAIRLSSAPHCAGSSRNYGLCWSCNRTLPLQDPIWLSPTHMAPVGGQCAWYCADCVARCELCERSLPINGQPAARLWPFRLYTPNDSPEIEFLVCGYCWARHPECGQGTGRPITSDDWAALDVQITPAVTDPD